MENLFTSILTDTMTLKTYLLCTVCALICGLIAAFVANYKSKISKSFFVSLILLPVIVETVIIMVNGNVGTGIAVAGAFSLVRFRSAPGNAKDIASIFFVMTAGLACAAGYIGIALIFTVIVCIILLVLANIKFGNEKNMILSITIPESVSFSNAFDDVFATYTDNFELTDVKTSNMGSLYKLKYTVKIKNGKNIQEFIDALRCRNGNLEISLNKNIESSAEL